MGYISNFSIDWHTIEHLNAFLGGQKYLYFQIIKHVGKFLGSNCLPQKLIPIAAFYLKDCTLCVKLSLNDENNLFKGSK